MLFCDELGDVAGPSELACLEVAVNQIPRNVSDADSLSRSVRSVSQLLLVNVDEPLSLHWWWW